MKLLNERYDYGLNLVLLSVDEGITGYRDDSLETVKRNKVGYLAIMDTVNFYKFCYLEVLSGQARNQSEYKAQPILQKVISLDIFYCLVLVPSSTTLFIFCFLGTICSSTKDNLL